MERESMSTTPITVLSQVEKPLDRLNYFNGQRLEAADLKLEQQYHIRVRRWLNKSLYTTGIAAGLEAVPDPANSQNVIVSPGMALDSLGREIILLDQVSIAVVGTPSTQPGVVKGNYLTIQYSEQTIEEEQDGCTVHLGNKKGCGCGNGNTGSKSTLAWGGPAFIRPAPILGFSDYLPSDTSGKIVLGQIELDKGCNVVSVHPEVRRYVGAASDALVHQFALEGARDFDYRTPQRIYFHIRGRQPNAVTLYLRAEQFPSIYYTELGRHTHGGSLDAAQTGPASHVDSHAHNPGTLAAQSDGQAGSATVNHGHTMQAYTSIGNLTDPPNGEKGKGGIYISSELDIGPAKVVHFLTDSSGNPIKTFLSGADPQIGPDGDHSHTIGGQTDSTPQVPPGTVLHTHSLGSSVTVGFTGVTDVNADTGRPALSYVADLQVTIDDNNNNVSADILTQLQDARPTQDWSRFGNGLATHALVQDGTGDIKLDLLPHLSFTEGEHWIELSVASGGGRILYNLYIE
jgi:hypothetical protein